MKKMFLFLILPLAIYSQEVFASQFGHNQYYFQSPTEAVIDEMIPKYQQEVMDYNLNLQNELQALQKDVYRPQFYDNNQYNQQNQGAQLNNYKQNQIFESYPSKQQNNVQNGRKNNSKNPYETQSTPKWWRQENSYQGWGFN